MFYLRSSLMNLGSFTKGNKMSWSKNSTLESGRRTLRPEEKLFGFCFFVNMHSRHKFHSCLGTTSYNAYPLPSLSTITTQSFSVWRQGQLKRLQTGQHRHLYPAILSISDSLRSIKKRERECQFSRQEQAQWVCSAPTFPLFCIIAFGSEAVI